MRASRLLALALLAGEADKIGGHPAVAVKAHRVRGVVVEGGDFFGAVVERDGAQERVDRAFGQREQLGVHALAAAHFPDAALGIAGHAAIGGDFGDERRAARDVRDRAGAGQGGGDGGAGGDEATLKESGIKRGRQIGLRRDEGRGSRADEQGVVLVDAVQGDAVGCGPGRFGERGAPREVRGVEDAGPIDRTEHDGRTGAEEHEADGFEGIIDGFDRFDPATAERVTDGRRDVETE